MVTTETYTNYSATPGSGWMAPGTIQVGAWTPTVEDPFAGEAAQFTDPAPAVVWLCEHGCHRDLAERAVATAFGGTHRIEIFTVDWTVEEKPA
jgi:hypothetical protein